MESPETKALDFANEVLNPLAPYGRLSALKEMTRRIGFTDNSKEGIKVTEAIHKAQMAFATRANPFNGELVHWVEEKFIDGKKKRILTLHWGRPYWVRLAEEWAVDHDTAFAPPEFDRILDAQKKVLYGAKPDDMVIVARVREEKAMDAYVTRLTKLIDAKYTKQEAEAIVGPPPYLEGVGIVTQYEIEKKFASSYGQYSPAERCMKRAYVNALKKKVTFTTPTVYGDNYSDLVKEDWNPKSGSEVIDAFFIPVEEDQSFSTETSDAVPEGFEDLAAEWATMFENGEARDYSDEDLIKRRKPAYWNESLLNTAMDRGVADNHFRVAALLAYSPYAAAKKQDDLSKTEFEQILNWLDWMNKVRKDLTTVPTMQASADFATRLTFGMLKSLDEVQKEIDEAAKEKEDEQSNTESAESGNESDSQAD